MSKWCFNYETGDYEDIDRDDLVEQIKKCFQTDTPNTLIIGTTANIDKKRRKNKIRKTMTGKNRLFVNSYGKEIK